MSTMKQIRETYEAAERMIDAYPDQFPVCSWSYSEIGVLIKRIHDLESLAAQAMSDSSLHWNRMWRGYHGTQTPKRRRL